MIYVHSLLSRYCRWQNVKFVMDLQYSCFCKSGVVKLSNRLFHASLLQEVRDVKLLQQVHSQILVSNLNENVFICNRLMYAYASCGLVHETQIVFSLISNKNVVSWTTLVSGLGKNGRLSEAIHVFSEMVMQEIKPNERTIASVLPALGGLKLVEMGKSVHCYWIRHEFGANVVVETGLVDMYSRCGCMRDARYMFDKMSVRNVVTWNSMISGYIENGLVEEALRLFNMMRREGVSVDFITVMSLVRANDLNVGSSIHGLMTKNGFDDDDLSKTALMEMYIDCDFIDDAYCIFQELNHPDLISWTLMLRGFTKIGDWRRIIDHFNQMMAGGHIKLDSISLITLLSGCSSSGALNQGKQAHALAIKTGIEVDTFVGSAVIDMYMNCASITDARRHFQLIERKDVACWNALISGCGMIGLANEAIELFYEMESSGMKPDELTFISILSACSHAGLVAEGLQIFHHMIEVRKMSPTSKHYACVVDLLSRAGLLKDAYKFMKLMHIQPGVEAYCSLLTACRIHKNFELVDEVSHELLQLNPDDAGYYVLVSNVNAIAGNSTAARMTRKSMKSSNMKKNPGCSCIEVNGEMVTFMAGQIDHSHYEKIKEVIFGLNSKDTEETLDLLNE